MVIELCLGTLAYYNLSYACVNLAMRKDWLEETLQLPTDKIHRPCTRQGNYQGAIVNSENLRIEWPKCVQDLVGRLQVSERIPGHVIMRCLSTTLAGCSRRIVDGATVAVYMCAYPAISSHHFCRWPRGA